LNPPLHKGFAIGYEKCPDFLDGVFEKEHGMDGFNGLGAFEQEHGPCGAGR
jgi:hypothetical protein